MTANSHAFAVSTPSAMVGKPLTGSRVRLEAMAPETADVNGGPVEIWINPECSKCRSALTILDAEQADYTVRHYLERPPSVEELDDVLRRLELEPWDIARLGEPLAEQLGLATWPRAAADRGRWIGALAAHPVLIQRPIITADDTASIARSPEAVRAALRRDDNNPTPPQA